MNASIIHRLNRSDPDALKELYDEFAPTIYRYVFSILHSDSDVQEVLQTVFIKIWDIRESLRDDTNIQSFFITISKNSSYNFLKKKYRERLFFSQLSESISQKAPELLESAIIEREINTKLSKLIDLLPAQRKKIFLLSRFDMLTYKEIAAQLKISENTVDTQMRKALKFLKIHMSDDISLILILFLFKFF